MRSKIESLIPQRGPLVLLSHIFNEDKTNYKGQVEISEKSLLFNGHGVPAWAAIEYMAQTVAAYNSSFLSECNDPELGFIVGVRNLTSKIPLFPLGKILDIYVEELFVDAQSGSFDCEVKINDTVVCTGRLTTYIPTTHQLIELDKEQK